MSRLPELSIREAAIAWGNAVNASVVHRKSTRQPVPTQHNMVTCWATRPEVEDKHAYSGWRKVYCAECTEEVWGQEEWPRKQRELSTAVARAQKILLRAIAREAGDADNAT